MKEKFTECDTDSSGLVSLDEAKAVLTKPPFNFPDEKVTAVIANCYYYYLFVLKVHQNHQTVHRNSINVIFTFVRLVLNLVSQHFKGCINVDSMVRKYCSLMRDDKRFGVAQFMRDYITA